MRRMLAFWGGVAAIVLAVIAIFDPTDGITHDLTQWAVFAAAIGLVALTIDVFDTYVKRTPGA